MSCPVENVHGVHLPAKRVHRLNAADSAKWSDVFVKINEKAF